MALINNGSGKFTWNPLPEILQRSPIFGIVIADINDDGVLDMICSGNDHSYSNEIGNLDAGGISAALGIGDGTFNPIGYDQLGVDLAGDVKAIGLISERDSIPVWLISANNGPWRIIALNPIRSLTDKVDHTVTFNGRRIEYYLGGSLATMNEKLEELDQ
jgi:hypothetical protein